MPTDLTRAEEFGLTPKTYSALPRTEAEAFVGTLPEYPLSPQERRDAAKRPEFEGGFYRTLGHAVHTESLMSWALRRYDRWTGKFEDEAGFRLQPKQVDLLTDGLDMQYWEAFRGVQSFDEAWLIREQMLQLQYSQRRLSQSGFSGGAAIFLANVLDPPQVALDFASGGIARAFIYAAKANRIRRMLAAGAIAAASNTPLYALRAIDDPTTDAKDVMVNAGMAFAAGGTFTGIWDWISPASRFEYQRAMLRKIKQMAGAEAADAGFEITESGQKTMHVLKNGEAWPEAQIRRAQRAMRGDILDPDDIPMPSEIITEADIDAIISRPYVPERQVGVWKDGNSPDLLEYLASEGVPTDTLVRMNPQERLRIGEELASGTAWLDLDMLEPHKPIQVGEWSTGNEESLIRFMGASGVNEDALVKMSPIARLQTARALREMEEEIVISYPSHIADKLDAFANRALKRIKDRNKGGRLFSGIPADDMADLVLAGSAKIIAGTLRREEWAKQMVEQFGKEIESQLPELWEQSQIAASRIGARAAYKVLMAERIKTASSGENAMASGKWWERMLASVDFSITGRATRSTNADMRKLARLLAWDLPDAKTNKSAFSALEFVEMRHGRMNIEEEKFRLPAWKNYVERNNIPLYRRGEAFEEFAARAKRAIQSRMSNESDPDVLAVAQGYRQILADDLAEMKASGVIEAGAIPEDPFYVPRIRVADKVANKIQEVGYDNVLEWHRQAIARKAEGLTPAQLEAAAKAMVDNTLQRDWAHDIPNARMMAGNQSEELADALRAAEVPEEQIQSILYVTVPDKDGKAPSRMKRRMAMDEDFTMTVTDVNGKETVISADDFTENNIQRLVQAYDRQASGAIAERKTLEAFAGEGEEAVPSWEVLIKRMRDKHVKEAREALESKKISMRQYKRMNSAFDRDIRGMEILHKAVLGIPTSDLSKDMQKWMNRLMKFNFSRVGGMFGLAQVPEFMNPLAEASLVSMKEAMPMLGDIIAKATKGELKNEFIREIQEAIGAGDGLLRRAGMRTRYDDWAIGTTTASGAVDRGIDNLANITSTASGLRHIDGVERTWAASIGAMNLAEACYLDRMPTAKRLAIINISPDEFPRIRAMVREFATREKGELGVSYRKLNLDKWTDKEAAAIFVTGVRKWADQAIQTNNIGNLHAWMTTDVGRLLMQFRGYVINAQRMQLMRGAYLRDSSTFAAWSWQILLGSLTYITLNYSRSIGRSDAKEFLKERFTLPEIAKGAFARAGFSALTPGAIDSVLQWTSFGPQFGYVRTSGMGADFITGSAPYDLVFRQALPAAKGIFGTMLNPKYRFSQQDARAFKGTMFWNNAFGVHNLLNSLISNLPKRSLPYGQQ